MENRGNILVTLADTNYIQQAKQLFSSVYWNAGWNGDYMLLAHEIPEKELKWFTDKGILIKKCKPLYDKKIGKENYPPVVLDKFYLFTPEFRKWKNIVFLDADIIVRASLEGLTKVNGFASSNVMGDRLKFFFHKDSNPINYQTLNGKYNLSATAFNSGVMAFPSKIIKDDAFNNLVKLFETYKDITSGDDPIFNLLFYKKWKKLSVIYDISPKAIEKYTSVPANNVNGIIIHLKEDELSDKKLNFYKEWEINLERAEFIDINKVQKAKKWNIFKIIFYSLILKIKFKFNSSFCYIIDTPDRLIGKFGIYLKKHNPKLYNKLRRIKDRYPSIFIIEITNTCIAKCHQCEMWKNKSPENEVTLVEKLKLIDEIQNLKAHKNLYIHFSGGEPFIKKDELLKLADYCMQKKINCGVDSTGYFIDEEMAKKISETRLTVNISLDSLIPEIHDNMRRLEDCHQRAIMAIDNLIKYGGNDRVVLVTVLTKKNIGHIDKLIKYADEKKVKILFQPLMFSPVKTPEFLKEEYWPDNKDDIENAFNTVKNLKKQGYNLTITDKKLASFKDYFKTGTPQIKCNYFKKKLSIDSLGDVRLCFFSEAIGNIRENSLKEIFFSKEAGIMRKKLKNCNNKSCNLPICQEPVSIRKFYLSSIFHYTVNTTDKLVGKFGLFVKKHNSSLYYRLKK